MKLLPELKLITVVELLIEKRYNSKNVIKQNHMALVSSIMQMI